MQQREKRTNNFIGNIRIRLGIGEIGMKKELGETGLNGIDTATKGFTS